jgi:hypothetical protein
VSYLKVEKYRLPKNKKPTVSGGRPFSILLKIRLGQRAPRLGMMVMMMPGRGKSCHKPKV